MFFRIIRKILQRHVKDHLLKPLAVGLTIEIVIKYLARGHEGPIWTVLDVIAPLLGIFVTYLVVMYRIFKDETEVGMQRITSPTLERALERATGFFGIGAIELREWFEPSPQVYLASIMKRKLDYPDFTYNRVLIFSKSAYKDLNSPYLNGYYAKALVDIHTRNGIGLAYLTPKELGSIMKKFGLDEGKAIGYYPAWLPNWLLKITPGSLRGVWHRRLALAVVKHGKDRRFLPFTKDGVIVEVKDIPDKITDEARNNAYSKLVDEIEKRVLKGTGIDPGHDFSTKY